MLAFKEGDIIAAYLAQHGFVGVGRITQTAKMIRDVTIKRTPLLDFDLAAESPGHHINNEEECEYVCLVKWIAKVPREKAKQSGESKLFTNPQIRASLENQRKTVEFIEREFSVSIEKYLR